MGQFEKCETNKQCIKCQHSPQDQSLTHILWCITELVFVCCLFACSVLTRLDGRCSEGTRLACVTFELRARRRRRRRDKRQNNADGRGDKLRPPPREMLRVNHR